VIELKKMKYIKCSVSICLLIVFTYAYAKTNDVAHYFQNKSGCFILYDASNGEMVEQYNPSRCATRVAPDSTFKVALSLMAFDQQIISSKTVFKWDGREKGMPQWDHDQTPNTWLTYSVVWVSRLLTPQLGLPAIKRYLDAFHYGNQDFSGTPGKNDGLMQAWMSNSLKISADEQLVFMKKLIARALPISKKSMELTQGNLFLKKFDIGWSLYGKTGSGRDANAMKEGWFVGFIEKGQRKYIFVTNFTSLIKIDMATAGGPIAKDITMQILHEQPWFS